jgi:cytochrome c oxidase subunit III
MKLQPTLNVKGLPESGFGASAPLWWGNLVLVAVESMFFLLCIASYYYLRLTVQHWPPERTELPEIVVGTVNVTVIALSAIPMRLVQYKMAKYDQRGAKLWLVIGLALGILAIVLRVYEFRGFHCQWDTHAYGSIVWLTVGLHTFHLLATVSETIVLTIWLFTHTLDDKHKLDIEVNSDYWFFVVFSWIVLYAVIYISPLLM